MVSSKELWFLRSWNRDSKRVYGLGAYAQRSSINFSLVLVNSYALSLNTLYLCYLRKPIDINMFSNYMCVFLFFSLIYLAECEFSKPLHPNIVLIVTDDQDSQLGGILPMKRTLDLVGKNGATFPNSFVASPICCPSRSSILTGMYPHNHHTTNNSMSGGCSSLRWQVQLEPKTFAAILHREGYKTFYAGKYLNEYGEKQAGGPSHVPEGWDVWRGLVGNSKYYNYTLSIDGSPQLYDNEEYLTDVIKEMALNFLDSTPREQPFLMFLAPPAPHAPFQPAPRHEETFPGVKALQTPSYNIPAGKDKHWIMQMPPSPLPNDALLKLDDVYRRRWQTLLAVDEMIEEVVQSLDEAKLLDNTYIIVTSDNGFHMGQFSQAYDKRQPYDTDIRVPFLIRGPGILEGGSPPYPIMNIDLAPTILQLAGLKPPADMDGVPIKIFSNPELQQYSMLETNDVNFDEPYDRRMLVEYSGEGSEGSTDCPWGEDKNLFMCQPDYYCKCQDAKNNTYSCVRNFLPEMDFIYCSFNDTKETEEAYHIYDDPFQLKNVINDLMPAFKYKYRSILEKLRNCKGESCNFDF